LLRDYVLFSVLPLFLVSCTAIAQDFGSASAIAAVSETGEFGNVPVNTSSAPSTLTLQFSGPASPPSLSLRFGLDFLLNSSMCTGSGMVTCQASVTFKPSYPGLRQDAVIVRDNLGNVLLTAFVSGIGVGPQWSVTPGTISTVASNFGTYGYYSLAVDPSGNLYLSNLDGTISLIAPNSEPSVIAGQAALNGGYGGDGGPGLEAQFNEPTGLALDGAGNLYIADSVNNLIRKLDTVTGIVTTVAGKFVQYPYAGEGGYAGDGGPALSALLDGPTGVAVDRTGNIYIADTTNNAVRRVDATSGNITAFAGTGSYGYFGDNGQASAAELENPSALALDNQGNLFIADGGSRVRRVDAQTGIITTVAGGPADTGFSAIYGYGLPATSLSLGQMYGLAVDAGGNLYISDLGSRLIHRVDAAGIAFNVAGGFTSMSNGGDGGPATQAGLNGPRAIALDGAGNLYFADGENEAVHKISAVPAALTFLASVPGPAWPQTISLTNTGNQPFSILGTTLAPEHRPFPPADAGDFQETNNCPSTLAPGNDCQVMVNFSPSQTLTSLMALLEIPLALPARGAASSPVISLSGYATAGTTCLATSFFLADSPTNANSAIVNADANCDYDIRVGSPGGKLLAQSNGLGAFATGNIVTDGLEFYLQERGNTSSQGTLAEAIGTAGFGICVVSDFSAFPSPDPGTIVIIFVNAQCDYDVRQGSPGGTLAGQGTGLALVQGSITAPSAAFYLQRRGDTTAGGTLAVLNDSYTSNDCAASQFFANPAPVFSSAPSGATTLQIASSCNWDVRVGGPSGTLLGSGVSGNPQQLATGNIGEKGTKFYLQQTGNTTPTGTMATLTVEMVQP
jgi:hypothetical protein